jgi:hypothetical protein
MEEETTTRQLFQEFGKKLQPVAGFLTALVDRIHKSYQVRVYRR